MSEQCSILLMSNGLGCCIFGKRKCWGLLLPFVDMAWEGAKMPYTVKKVCVRLVMREKKQNVANEVDACEE